MAKDRNEGTERFQKRQREKKDYAKQLPTEEEPALPPPVEPIHGQGKTGRNDPCPCGSGKKFKLCCGRK